MALYSGFTPTIYAAPTDQGNGSGSSEANAQDLPTALANATAGDIIGCLPGTYIRSVLGHGLNTWQPLFRPTNEGSSGNPIRIVCKYPAVYLSTPGTNADRSEFQTSDHVLSAPPVTHPLLGNGENHDYIEWYGFYIDQTDAPAYPSKGTCQASQGSIGIGFYEFYIDQRYNDDGDNYSCFFCEDSDNLVIRNFIINGPSGVDGGHNVTCGTLYGCKNFSISHGEHYGASSGWFCKGSNINNSETDPYSYGVAEYNWFEDAVVTCFTINEAEATGTRFTIRYNVGVGCGALLIIDNSTVSPPNPPWDHKLTKNVYVHNNTVVNPTNSVAGGFYGTGVRCDHQVDDGQWYNNIIAYLANPGQQVYHVNLGGSEPTPTATHNTDNFSVFDYNCYYMAAGTNRWVTNGTTYTSFANWEAAVQADVAGQEDHSITGNPNFTNAGSGDYTLNSGTSPCWGTGLGSINMGALLAGMTMADIGVEADDGTPVAGAHRPRFRFRKR